MLQKTDMAVSWKTKSSPQDALVILKRVTGRFSGVSGNGFFPAQLFAAMFNWDPETPSSQYESILLRAVNNAKNSGKLLDAKGVLAEVQKSEQIYLKQPKQTFVIITTLSILADVEWFSNFFHPRRINNSRLTFYQNHPRDFRPSPSGLIQLNQFKNDLEGRVYVRIRTRARTYVEAVNNALWDLDLLRGIWNLFINYGSFTYFAGGLPKPCNEILRGPIITAKLIGDSEPTQDFVNTSYVLSWPLPTILSRDSEKILSLEKKTRRKLRGKPWKNELVDWLVLYCRSLDLSDRHNSFLGLWQALEMMTISDSERHDQIPSRVSWLYDDYEFERIIVDVLRGYRNEAVHSAREIPGDEYLVSELRRHVENLLRFYIFSDIKIESLEAARELLKTPVVKDKITSKINMYRTSLRFRSRNSA